MRHLHNHQTRPGTGSCSQETADGDLRDGKPDEPSTEDPELEELHTHYRPTLTRLHAARERQELHDALGLLLAPASQLSESERDLARAAQQELLTEDGREDGDGAGHGPGWTKALEMLRALTELEVQRAEEARARHSRNQWRAARHRERRTLVTGGALLLLVAWVIISWQIPFSGTGTWLLVSGPVALALWFSPDPALRLWERRHPLPEPTLRDLRRMSTMAHQGRRMDWF